MLESILKCMNYLQRSVVLLFFLFYAVSCAQTQSAVPEKKMGSLPDLINDAKEFENPKRSKDTLRDELIALHQIKPKEYKIGAGDVFDVYVYDEDELTTKNAIVKSDGTLSTKLAGNLKVSGLTLEVSAQKIASKLKKFLNEPKVTLVPLELKNARFRIIGKVNKPGMFSIENDTRVLDAVALAGGFTTGIFKNNTVEMADLEHSFIVRGDKVLPVDLVNLVRKGDMLQNIPLQDGDYIYISSAMNKELYVLGEVNAPGFFGYREGITLLQLLAKAKGFKNSAKRSQVILVRGGLRNPRVYSINVKDLLKGNIQDILLQPEDVVYVPKSFLGNWEMVFSMLMPSIQSLQTGILLYNTIK